MKHCSSCLCAILLFVNLFSAGSQQPEHLDDILAEVAGYCEKFASASLNYVCLEDIREILYFPYRKNTGFMPRISETRRNHYVYDYQLVLEKNNFKEQRILIKENGRKVRIVNSRLRTERIYYEKIVLGPLIMSWESQALHDYRIIGEEKFDKTPCLIIEALPKPGTSGNHLIGKIWVGKQDQIIRKLEWNPESVENPECFKKTATELKAEPQMKFVLELGFEKRGLRFPSRFIQIEEYKNSRGEILTRSETTVDYRDYKFFTVETNVGLLR